MFRHCRRSGSFGAGSLPAIRISRLASGTHLRANDVLSGPTHTGRRPHVRPQPSHERSPVWPWRLVTRGPYGACCEREYDGEGVPHSARITGIRYLRQALQQAGNFPGRGPGVLTELVKGRRDQG